MVQQIDAILDNDIVRFETDISGVRLTNTAVAVQKNEAVAIIPSCVRLSDSRYYAPG